MVACTHEGQAIAHRRLRAAFERGVRYLPAAGKYVVQLGHFRGQLDVEECGFFVRGVDLAKRKHRALGRQQRATRSGVAARFRRSTPTRCSAR